MPPLPRRSRRQGGDGAASDPHRLQCARPGATVWALAADPPAMGQTRMLISWRRLPAHRWHPRRPNPAKLACSRRAQVAVIAAGGDSFPAQRQQAWPQKYVP